MQSTALARTATRSTGVLPHCRLQPLRTCIVQSAAAAMVPHPEQPVQPQPPPPAQLWQGICSVYDAAQASGAANRTDTSVVLEPDGGIDFVLRVAAALRAKPRAAAPTGDKPRNPFLPYEEALWVAHLSATHTLLLNKFNVVRHHVLVVTRQFESQTDPLNAADLAAAQQVLEAMPTGGVAFYNCGEHSGRSQPHKHLQVVPLPLAGNMECSGGDGAVQHQQQQAVGKDDCGYSGAPMEHIVLQAAAAAGAAPLEVLPLRALPYRAYAVVLPPGVSPQQLEAAARALLARCQAGLVSPVSYNALLTRRTLMLVPRRQEASGPVAVNALGFAGTVLLRSDEDLAYARQRRPLVLLADVAHPWDSEPDDNVT